MTADTNLNPLNELATFRIFEMNDCDWWLARTAEEAKADMVELFGDNGSPPPREITEKELDELIFYDDLSDQRASGKRSFRAELNRRREAGITSPEPFASTEY